MMGYAYRPVFKKELSSTYQNLPPTFMMKFDGKLPIRKIFCKFSAKPTHLSSAQIFASYSSSHMSGFLRFLSMLSNHDWQNDPLIIDLNESLTGMYAAISMPLPQCGSGC